MRLRSEKLCEREDYYADPNEIELGSPEDWNIKLHRDYAEILKEFEEESFYYDGLDYKAYRFVRSGYLKNTLLLRVEKRKSVVLFWQEKSWPDPGELSDFTTEKSAKLAPSIWLEIEGVMTDIGFWEIDMPQRKYNATAPGTSLIIEGWNTEIHQIIHNDHLPFESNQELDELLTKLVAKTRFSENFKGFTLPKGAY